MPFFIDTNVAFGYTVIHDKWHEKANSFITNNANSLFWSNLVQQEYSNKFDDVLDDINHYLDSIESILENNQQDFSSYHDFEKFIIKKTQHTNLDGFKKRKILENFWINNIDYGISERIYLNFLGYKMTFNRIYFKRDEKLYQIVNLHDCGLNNYLKYLDYANKIHDWGIHVPDCKIIVDAHDCALENWNLKFVSYDEKMIKRLKEKDTSFLKIHEFVSLN